MERFSRFVQAENIPNDLPTYDRTLYLFSMSNKLRLFCDRLISYPAFEYTILAFILASSLFLAIENPLDSQTSTKSIILSYLNLCMTIIFALEILAKIISKGLLINGKDSYLRSYWNALDFIIVILSIVSECFLHSKLKIFKILRMIKILRPLRVIGRNEGLKLAVDTLIHVIPNVFNVSIISLIFYMIFGVFCVTFTKGELYYCYTE
jgi:Ion transport protein